MSEQLTTDFSTWERKTLERLAAEAVARIEELTADNRMLHDLWRKELTK
jgi:hypothetical protein